MGREKSKLHIALIEATLGTDGRPENSLQSIAGRPLLTRVVERMRRVRGLDEIVILIPDDASDDPIEQYCRSESLAYLRGSRNDALDRCYQAASEYRADAIVRVRADCPLLDPALVDRTIGFFEAGAYDLFLLATATGVSAGGGPCFPDGLDTECLRTRALANAWEQAHGEEDRMSLIRHMWRNPQDFHLGQLRPARDLSDLRWRVRDPLDFERLEPVLAGMSAREASSAMEEVLAFLREHPEITAPKRVAEEGDEKELEPS